MPILPYRGFVLDKPKKMFRLMKTFAEGGDARKFVAEFTAENFKDKIPVGFAWYFFQALVDAAISMHEQRIIHRDLTLESIMLAVVKEEHGSWTLKPQIGDFGAAFPLTASGTRDPADLDSTGAKDFLAPEQYETDPPVLPSIPPSARCEVSEMTTVFHIG